MVGLLVGMGGDDGEEGRRVDRRRHFGRVPVVLLLRSNNNLVLFGWRWWSGGVVRVQYLVF